MSNTVSGERVEQPEAARKKGKLPHKVGSLSIIET